MEFEFLRSYFLSPTKISWLVVEEAAVSVQPLIADDARRLFDGMPPRKKLSSALRVSSADRIGSLPDSFLHQLLSFLPAQEAMQTCVLARRWRHLWRSTTGLRIDDDGYYNFQDLRKFVDHLVFLRERTDLDTVEIKLGIPWDDDDVQHCVNLWIRFAVMCKVRVLNLDIYEFGHCLNDQPLVSRHLRTLNLHLVTLPETFLDFASCPALEDLKMANCDILASKISSRSLKHLGITDCCSDLDYRFCVSTPGLVSLKIVGFVGKTPFLENMALLETAYVEFDKDCEDVCLKYESGVFCGDNNDACENCVPIKDDCSRNCVLLGGISSHAKHLKLLSESRMFIFTRDLKHCPTFSKLKTLLLNEYWCDAPDLGPLACILKNSPVLEKLTLQLCSTRSNHQVKMIGSYSSMEGPFAMSQHLKMVEVKCNVVDERIARVLKFLTAFNIRFGFV
ncbi:unnamed protein product [Alopecurus aequalis]